MRLSSFFDGMVQMGGNELFSARQSASKFGVS